MLVCLCACVLVCLCVCVFVFVCLYFCFPSLHVTQRRAREVPDYTHTSSSSHWQAGHPVYLLRLRGFKHRVRFIPQQRFEALLSSPITLDAPPTSFRTDVVSGFSEHVGRQVELLDALALQPFEPHELSIHSVLVPSNHLHKLALDGLQLLRDGGHLLVHLLLQTRKVLFQLLDLGVKPCFQLPSTRLESGSRCTEEVADLFPSP